MLKFSRRAAAVLTTIALASFFVVHAQSRRRGPGPRFGTAQAGPSRMVS